MTKSYGHKYETPDPRDLPIGLLLERCGNAAHMPESYDFAEESGAVLDQLGTSSCVGHAGIDSIYTCGILAGIKMRKLSVLFGYGIARESMLDSPDSPLVDDGAYPRALFRGVAKRGVVANSEWPFSEAKVNEKLPFDLFEKGLEARVQSYHFIQTSGSERCAEIRKTLWSKKPVCFAMHVDEAYENFSGDGIYMGREGKALGSHYQYIVGYGPGYFLVKGSWGKSLGAGGFVKISDDYIGSLDCLDFGVPDVVPAVI